MQLYEVYISAETKDQAYAILNALLAKKLATGGQIIEAPAHFLWKGDIVDMDYKTITSFTVESKKKALVKEVETISVEEVPMIRFVAIETNDKLMEWVVRTLDVSA